MKAQISSSKDGNTFHSHHRQSFFTLKNTVYYKYFVFQITEWPEDMPVLSFTERKLFQMTDNANSAFGNVTFLCLE